MTTLIQVTTKSQTIARPRQTDRIQIYTAAVTKLELEYICSHFVVYLTVKKSGHS